MTDDARERMVEFFGSIWDALIEAPEYEREDYTREAFIQTAMMKYKRALQEPPGERRYRKPASERPHKFLPPNTDYCAICGYDEPHSLHDPDPEPEGCPVPDCIEDALHDGPHIMPILRHEPEGEIYPCDRCGKPRTNCDRCWDETHAAPATSESGEEPPGGEPIVPLNGVVGRMSSAIEELRDCLRDVDAICKAVPRRAPDEGVGACGICGGRLALIRGKHPRDEDRTVCPTCLKEKSERVVEMFSPKPPGDGRRIHRGGADV